MIVQLAFHHLLGGFHNRHCPFLVEQAELEIDPGGALLDHPQGTEKGTGKAQSGDGEIDQRPGGLGAVESAGGNRHLAHRVLFNAGIAHNHPFALAVADTLAEC